MTPTFEYASAAFSLPHGTSRAKVEDIDENTVKMIGWKETIQNANITPTTCHNRKLQWILKDADKLPRRLYQQFNEAIRSGIIKIVSDGSYCPISELGTAAWIIEFGAIQLHGAIQVPGHKADQCSHRSEIFGLIAGINHLNKLCQTVKITSGNCSGGCDGEGSIYISNESYDIVKSSRKHFDAIQSLHSVITHSTIHLKLEHIKGHKDDTALYSTLSREEQLNVQADSCAKQHMEKVKERDTTDTTNTDLPHSTCSIFAYSSNQWIRISSSLLNNLSNIVDGNRLRQYWNKKHKYGSLNETRIDWSTLECSHKAMVHPSMKWLCKFRTGFCGIGSKMVTYKKQSHSHCPRCYCRPETTTHLLQCRHPEVDELWTNQLNDTKKWFLSYGGPKTMIETILQEIHCWRKQTPRIDIEQVHLPIRNCVHVQRQIGWKKFIEGFITTEWLSFLTIYFDDNKIRKSAKRMISQLQRRIWTIIWNIWDHRNTFVHDRNQTLNNKTTMDINQEIKMNIHCNWIYCQKL